MCLETGAEDTQRPSTILACTACLGLLRSRAIGLLVEEAPGGEMLLDGAEMISHEDNTPLIPPEPFQAGKQQLERTVIS